MNFESVITVLFSFFFTLGIILMLVGYFTKKRLTECGFMFGVGLGFVIYSIVILLTTCIRACFY